MINLNEMEAKDRQNHFTFSENSIDKIKLPNSQNSIVGGSTEGDSEETRKSSEESDTLNLGIDSGNRVEYRKFYEEELAIAAENREAAGRAEEDRNERFRRFVWRLATSEEKTQYFHRNGHVLDELPLKQTKMVIESSCLWVKDTTEEPLNMSSTKIDYQVEQWSNQTCNRYVSVWTSVLSLANSPLMILELIKQLDMYTSIKAAVRSEVGKQEPEFAAGFDFCYRFGEPLRDVFQGLEFEVVCLKVFVALHVKQLHERQVVDLNGSRTEYGLEFCGLDEGRNLLSHCLAKKLSEALDFDFQKLLQNAHEKLGFAPDEQRIIWADQGILERLITRETQRLLSQDKLKQPFAADVTKIAFFMWILNNLSHSELIPYSYTVLGLNDSFLNLYYQTLIIGQRYQPDAPKLTNFSQAILDSIKSPTNLECHIRELFERQNKELWPLIVVHKNLSTFKKSFEEILDLAALCKHFGETSLPRLLDSLKACKDQPEKPINLAKEDVTLYILSNKHEFHALINEYERYANLQLDFDQTTIWHEILHSRRSMHIVKRYDSSALVSIFQTINLLFLEFIKRTPEMTSELLNFQQLISQLDSRCKNGTNDEFFVTFRTTKLKIAHLLSSKEVRSAFKEKVEKELQILKNLVCFSNIEAAWEQLTKDLRDLSSHETNLPVDQSLRFEILKGRKGDHLRLPKLLKQKVKSTRRFKPEYVLPVTNWDFLKHLIGNAHWKVQNGLFAWFSVYVERFPYKLKVIKLLEKFGLGKITSRTTAIMFFGCISKFYRLLEDAQNLHGFHERFSNSEFLNGIPIEIMIDIDTSFGYSETSKEENVRWDQEFFGHLYEWLNRDSSERLFGVSIVSDFALVFDNVVADMCPTLPEKSRHQKQVFISVSASTFRELNALFFELFGELKGKRPREYYAESECLARSHVTFFPYEHFCQNYLNFSATGSARKFRMSLMESSKFSELQLTDPSKYNQIKAKFNKTITEEAEKDTAVSKTVVFGYSGKNLSENFIDVYGPRYKPELSCFIKRESKKLRSVINADLISYAKQTYVHDWIKQCLAQNVLQTINSLMTPRQRVLGLRKMRGIGVAEKWCVPMDLKDFHHHFGKSHFEAAGKAFLEQVRRTVFDKQMREDFEKIFLHMGEDLSKGELTYSLISEEADLFSAQIDSKSEAFHVKKSKLNTPDGAPAVYKYTLKFKLNNGLMSGWKVTSLFGSLFNLTLNRMSLFFTLAETQELFRDLNILGDDTHLKRRHLSSALNHTAFVNMIGKIAHPDKQILSTVSSEFLKKKINTCTGQVTHSINRMWNSLLYSKTSLKSEMNQSEFVKMNIDIWNLFVSRIDAPKLKQSISKQEYVAEFFAKLFKIERFDAVKLVRRMLDTPTLVNGCGSGPLRSLKVDFTALNEQKMNVVKSVFLRMELKRSLALYVLEAPAGHFEGVRSEVNGLLSLFHGSHKGPTRLADHSIRARLTTQIVNEISEGTTQFFDETGLEEKTLFGTVKKRQPTVEFTEVKREECPAEVFCEGNSLFCPHAFLDYAFDLLKTNLVEGYEFNNVAGELIYHSESITKSIFECMFEDKPEGFDIWPVLQGILKMKAHKGANKRLLKQSFDQMGDRLFLKVAASNDFSVPFGRNYKLDEIIGYLGPMFTKALYLYLLSHKSFAAAADKEMFLKQVIITLDFYVNQNTNIIIDRLEKLLAETD